MQNPRMLDVSTNLEAPEIYPGENADVGPQHILKAGAPRKTWFEVVADSQYFYSDNLFLSDKNKQDGSIFVNTIQAAFAPEPFALGSGKMAVAVGFRSQWFNYGLGGGPTNISALDFNAQTAFATARYQFGNWQAYGEFDFTRLLSQPNYVEAYREYVPSLGIQRVFPVCDKLVLSAGASVGYHWTETPVIINQGSDVNDRFDASISLSASWEPIRKLVIQPIYRFQFTDYPHFTDSVTTTAKPVERQDQINTFGLTTTYYFTKNISARIFANYEIRLNDYSAVYTYHKFDGGGGLGLDIRF